VCLVICNNLTSYYTQMSQNIVLYCFCCIAPRLACADNYVYKTLETRKSLVTPSVTGTAFCKPGKYFIPNVPYRDTRTSRSKPGRLVSLSIMILLSSGRVSLNTDGATHRCKKLYSTLKNTHALNRECSGQTGTFGQLEYNDITT